MMFASPDDSNSTVPPAPSNFIDNPGHWRELAKEMRLKAEQMIDPAAKASMLEAAKHYDRLAELAEAREDQR